MEAKEMQATDTVDSNMNINADENAGGTSHLNDNVEESETSKLQLELDEQKDKYLRLLPAVCISSNLPFIHK